jgi:phosphoglycolate phosphatase-like HAD superfamily hydrolase
MLNKRNCFVFDLDGTLCDVRHRRQYVATKPKNWNAWNAGLVSDKPHLPVQKVFKALRNLHYSNDYSTDLIIVSGRSDDYKEQTVKWLTDNEIFYDEIYMRKYKDNRDDAIVKFEIADEIEKTHNILGVFDDRHRVVNMWIQRGIFVFDVGQGQGNF